REEAYYFAPQGMTKIMNEGWACVEANTRVYTNSGLLRMADVVRGCAQTVSDGDGLQSIYDQNIIPDQETVIIKTRRGLRLEGSITHRLLMNDGKSWKRLDEIKIGDRVLISGGDGLFGQEYLSYDFSMPHRMTLMNVGERVGVSPSTVSRHISGRRGSNATEIDRVLEDYYQPENQEIPFNTNNRASFKVPEYLEQELGSFLGYLVGDGHISRVKRVIGLTSGDKEQALEFQSLCKRLFDLEARLRLDENRWRVELSSQNLSDFLTNIVGLTHGPSASEKRIPEDVLYSPEDVVSAFLRSYFDCDAYAGSQGVILSTASEEMSQQVQLLLMNFRILSRRRLQADGVWHLHITGASAKIYGERIGFGLQRKTDALNAYINDRKWFKEETWDDEIVSIVRSRADVYDISVSESHRYAAAGFINHNSYWHSKLMTGGLLDDSELIDYADRHSGTMGGNRGSLNPYKVGIELFRNIEERWDKGQFGKEWEECDNLERKQNWDTRAGKGKEKIFQARRVYNDVTFIDEFLTEDFCKEHKLFVYDYNRQTGEYVISSRDFRSVKNKLLGSLVNFGQPVIVVENANYQNRGELYLRHQHEDTDLKITLALDTLKNLHSVWSRPVHLETAVDSRRKLYSFDGKKHSERNLS
ncbi:MAG: SpoVR family protein, partial [Planctomycetota bacterium]|nr:SpoVR family protein [Planctomycetota bacterium]